jgi:hypothetical protein
VNEGIGIHGTILARQEQGTFDLEQQISRGFFPGGFFPHSGIPLVMRRACCVWTTKITVASMFSTISFVQGRWLW